MSAPDDAEGLVRHFLVAPRWTGSDQVGVVEELATRFVSAVEAPSLDFAWSSRVKSGTSSLVVQGLTTAIMLQLGFRSEASGLFNEYPVKNLRPDYYAPLPGGSGIIFEVERGKTIINNMDLLDLWKCHLCRQAHHLWLMVPRVTMNGKGGVRERPFPAVVKRLSTFFHHETVVDVRSVTIFGY